MSDIHPGPAGVGNVPNRVDDYANHYSLLRTIEDSLGLPRLTNNDAYAYPLNGFWGSAQPADQIAV